MNKNDIFIGNIRIKKDDNDEIYQTVCPLLFLGNGSYVNLDWVNTPKEKFNLHKMIVTGEMDTELAIYESCEEGIYVDKYSLIPYYKDFDRKPNIHNVSIKRLRDDMLYDPRIPGKYKLTSEGLFIHIKNPNPNKVLKHK